MNARISAIVYAALTLLAVAAAATAKGYASSLGEFVFVVAVSSLGLAIAHFWAQTLARRLTAPVSRDWLLHELQLSSLMLLPGVVLIAVAAIAQLVSGAIEIAVTAAMVSLTVVLFAYTWLGTRALLWSLGTAAVGVLMIVFKVVA